MVRCRARSAAVDSTSPVASRRRPPARRRERVDRLAQRVLRSPARHGSRRWFAVERFATGVRVAIEARARSRRWRGLVPGGLAICASACALVSRAAPPRWARPAVEDVRYDGAVARVGPAYLARRGNLWVMHLE